MNYLPAPTYVSPTSFSVPGDATALFAFTTRLKTINTGPTVVYGTVIGAVFSGGVTTVTQIADSGAMDAGLSAVATGVLTVTNPSLAGAQILAPNRNKVINGMLRYDQEFAAVATTLTAAAAVKYVADNFYASCTGANVTAQRVAGSGYQFAERLTGAASNTGTLFGWRMAGSRTRRWVSKRVFVQIPISSTSITSLTWNAYSANTLDAFSAKTLIATGTIAVSSTVDRKVFSFNAGANAANDVAIELVSGGLLAAQTLIYQGEIQAEVDTLTPFEELHEDDDLRACQWLWCKTYAQTTQPGTGTASGRFFGSGNISGTMNAYVQFPAQMRIAPKSCYGTPRATPAKWQVSPRVGWSRRVRPLHRT
jgi:hypothetical protein